MSEPRSATSKPSQPKSPARGKPQPRSAATPVDAFDEGDPGDSTQRNFRYQHAYGVILLVASKLSLRPYVAIWCEQHEDYLAERTDRTFDGYQIKTSRPENGAWKLNNLEFVKAIGRFAELVQEFGDAINGLFFVSIPTVRQSAGTTPTTVAGALSAPVSRACPILLQTSRH
jgi:hypothetical protein